jgi:hypothetical protein
MVFNATFKNISVISWRSVLLLEEIGVPGENHRPEMVTFKNILLYLINNSLRIKVRKIIHIVRIFSN